MSASYVYRKQLQNLKWLPAWYINDKFRHPQTCNVYIRSLKLTQLFSSSNGNIRRAVYSRRASIPEIFVNILTGLYKRFLTEERFRPRAVSHRLCRIINFIQHVVFCRTIQKFWKLVADRSSCNIQFLFSNNNVSCTK